MKSSKKVIMVSIGFIFLGIVLMTVGYFAGGRSGVILNSTGIYSAGTYPGYQKKEAHFLQKTGLEDFTQADIKIKYADFKIIPSDGYYLEYKLSGNSTAPKYSVDAGKLVFTEGKSSSHNNVSINFMWWGWGNRYNAHTEESYYVNLYVPEDQYFGLLAIYNDYGNMNFDGLNADTLLLEMDYGNLVMGNVNCKELEIVISYGNMDADNIEAERIKIDNNYGKVAIQDLKADTAAVNLDSGNMRVGKAEVQRLKVENDYGDVDIKDINSSYADIRLNSGNLELGGADIVEADIENDYGNVLIDLKGKFKDYNYELYTDYGRIKVPADAGVSINHEDDEYSYKADNGSARAINVNCNSGDVWITEPK